MQKQNIVEDTVLPAFIEVLLKQNFTGIFNMLNNMVILDTKRDRST